MRKSIVHAFVFSFLFTSLGRRQCVYWNVVVWSAGAVDDATARSRPLCWSDAIQLKANKVPQVSEPRSRKAMGEAKVRVALCLNDVCAGLRRETDVCKSCDYLFHRGPYFHQKSRLENDSFLKHIRYEFLDSQYGLPFRILTLYINVVVLPR
jgi:hypothetical protein